MINTKKPGKGIGLRLGVKTQDAQEWLYTLEFLDQQNPEDVVFESNNIKIYVDPKSLVYIDGTELDFTREGINEG